MIEKDDILERIAGNVSLNEGPEGVQRVLRVVFRKGPVSSKELARQTFLPIPIAVAVRNELQTLGLVQKSPRGTVLSSEGLQLVKKRFGFDARFDARCSVCEGSGLVLPRELEYSAHQFSEICRERPPPRTDLDQARATSDTGFARALQMHEDGNIDGKRISFLGDGDLVAIAVELIGNPKEVLVIDLDERLVNYVIEVAEKHDLEINTKVLDAREPFPAELLSRYDVFSTDPPFSIQGSCLFVFRGFQLLRKKLGVAGYLSLRLPDSSNLMALQRFVLSSGFVFREIKLNFNRYEGAAILGNRSDFYVLKAGPEFLTASLEDTFSNDISPIYTGTLRPTLRIYKCLNCGALYRVGEGQPYKTIEALKNRGCEAFECGKKAFTLVERINTS